MLYLLILIIMSVLLYKYREYDRFHLILIILMYGFYLLLWFMPEIDDTVVSTEEHIKHTNSALGVSILFLLTMPVYLLIHIIFIMFAKKKINFRSKIFKSHIIGSILLLIQIAIFLVKTNFPK